MTGGGFEGMANQLAPTERLASDMSFEPIESGTSSSGAAARQRSRTPARALAPAASKWEKVEDPKAVKMEKREAAKTETSVPPPAPDQEDEEGYGDEDTEARLTDARTAADLRNPLPVITETHTCRKCKRLDFVTDPL